MVVKRSLSSKQKGTSSQNRKSGKKRQKKELRSSSKTPESPRETDLQSPFSDYRQLLRQAMEQSVEVLRVALSTSPQDVFEASEQLMSQATERLNAAMASVTAAMDARTPPKKPLRRKVRRIIPQTIVKSHKKRHF